MDSAAMEKWRARRAGGPLRFIVLIGGLFGVVYFAVSALVIPPLFQEPWPEAATLARNAAIDLLILGPIFGAVVWWLNERAYDKALAERAARASAEDDG